jgi:hypothetical protein
MRTTILTMILAMFCCITAKADTNAVTKTLLSSTNYSITYRKADGGIVIFSPDYKSKDFQKGIFSFNEAQRFDIVQLLEKYVDLSIALENNDVKTFSKHLGSIPSVSDGLKLAIGLDATIYVSPEGKSLLILEKRKATWSKNQAFSL